MEVSVYLGESILSTQIQLFFLKDLQIFQSLPQSAMQGNSARLEVEERPKIHLLEGLHSLLLHISSSSTNSKHYEQVFSYDQIYY